MDILQTPGRRQLYRPYNAPLRLANDGSGLPLEYTTAQVYQPTTDIAILLEELRVFLGKNIAEGRNCINDNRIIKRIYRQLKALGFDWLSREFVEKLEASLTELDADCLLDTLNAMGKNAIQIRINLELARGQSNACIDKAISPISVVSRAAIVAARAYDLSLVAGQGRIPSWNFASLLKQPIPVTLLRKCDDTTDENRVVRQALHLFRVLFLQDPDHLKRGTKNGWKLGEAPHILPDEDEHMKLLETFANI